MLCNYTLLGTSSAHWSWFIWSISPKAHHFAPDIFTCALVSYEYLCGFNIIIRCIFYTLILLSCNITVVLQKSIHGWSWLASATIQQPWFSANCVPRCQMSLWSMHSIKNSPYYILVRTPGNDESICWILLITWSVMSKMGAENTTTV